MKFDRRTFIKKTSLGVAAAAVSPYLFSCDNQAASDSPFGNIGIQLYTLRDLVQAQPERVFEHLANIGYKHVELFGADTATKSYFGVPVADLKKMLSDNGLKTYSGHYDLSQYLNPKASSKESLPIYIEMANELGQEYIIAPVCPMDDLNALTTNDYQYFAEQLNAGGEMTKKAGIRIGYHNHFWEFKEFGNRTKGLDIMLAFTEPELVDFELDMFWAIKAGQNPEEYFEKYPHRFPMWHIKDMDRSVSEPLVLDQIDPKTGKRSPMDVMSILGQIRYAEVGSGSIDYVNISRFAAASGLKYAFVEQDDIYMDDKIASVRKSYEYIQKNLAK